MKTRRRVGATGAAVGDPPVDFFSEGGLHRIRVLGIEVAHILVEWIDIPEAGTGRRTWMSHDAYAAGTARAERATASLGRFGLEPQVTSYDEGGLRLYVTRREARVDVSFRSLDGRGVPRYNHRTPLWLLTALETPSAGLRLLEQTPGTGEEATTLLLGLARHLAANPPTTVSDPTDVRYLQVYGLRLRARRFGRGLTQRVRVDRCVTWKDGAPPSWSHVFDGALVLSVAGQTPFLRVEETSEQFSSHWGQVEHLVRFAVYAAFVSAAPAADVMRDVAARINAAWGVDEAVLALPEVP